jgi:hypothetical protein
MEYSGQLTVAGVTVFPVLVCLGLGILAIRLLVQWRVRRVAKDQVFLFTPVSDSALGADLPRSALRPCHHALRAVRSA